MARPHGDVDMAVTPALQADLLAAVRAHSATLPRRRPRRPWSTSTARGSSCCSACTARWPADGADLIVVAPPGSGAARLLGLVALGDIGEVRPSLAEALDTLRRPRSALSDRVPSESCSPS